MTTTYEIKCAKCDVPVELVTEANAKIARCSVCGMSDTQENAVREAGDYVTDQVAKGLDDMLAGIARGSKMMKHTPGSRDHRTYRFIVDYRPEL